MLLVVGAGDRLEAEAGEGTKGVERIRGVERVERVDGVDGVEGVGAFCSRDKIEGESGVKWFLPLLNNFLRLCGVEAGCN